MTPGFNNGLFNVSLGNEPDYRDDVRLGFYVADAAERQDEIQDLFKTDAGDLSYDEKLERLEGIKKELTDMGFETGPIEKKTHREWVAEVFDVTDLPEPSELEDEIELESDEEYDERE